MKRVIYFKKGENIKSEAEEMLGWIIYDLVVTAKTCLVRKDYKVTIIVEEKKKVRK